MAPRRKLFSLELPLITSIFLLCLKYRIFFISCENCSFQIGLTVVDEGYGETPALKKDIFWNDKIEPLYTLESAHDEQPMCGITGSTANIKFVFRINKPNKNSDILKIEILVRKH